MPNISHGYLLKGNVFFDKFDVDGTPKGEYIEFGNTTKFEYAPGSVDAKKRLGRGEKNYNQVLDQVILPGTPEIKVAGDGFDRDLVTLQFAGADSDYTQSLATVTDEDATLVLNKWIRLANRKLDAGLTMAGKVEGTDFLVNYQSGLIMALNSGAAGAKQVSYTCKAATGYTIEGGQGTTIRGALLLIGVNMANNKRCEFLVKDTLLSADGAIDFFATDWANLSLTGSLRIPTGETSAFVYTEYS